MPASLDPLLPANEASRLRALQPYKVLTATPDVVFDELVRLAAKLFDLPIALISLVDADQVWFKANFGMANPAHAPRQASMCSVAVLAAETIVFEDLVQEPCLLVDQAVVEAMHMRFYAGHPLQTLDGYHIGTLCVIGREPRPFRLEERQRLQALADVVAELLRLRLVLQQSATADPTLWLALYEELDQYLTRLDTLKELSHWETDANSFAFQSYQRSITEEADRVIRTLQRRIQAIQAHVA